MPQLSIAASSYPPRATVIFLHGLGQTNLSWMPWVQQLAQHLPTVTWILPQAEIGPVTHDKSDGPRWFDVRTLPPGEDEDERPAAAASNEQLQGILEDVIADGLPSQKVFFIGFSQGSAMALLSGLTSRHNLGGVAVLAGWLPSKLKEAVLSSPPAACPPLFWAQGTADRPIPLQTALDTAQWIRSAFAVDKTGFVFQEYPGLEHDVNDEVLRDLCVWLANLL